MENRSAFVVALLAVVCCFGGPGCGGDNIRVRMGEEGGPCYPNGTCNEGLECRSDICVDPGPCTAGSTGPCQCTNGDFGMRRCGPDGTWGDCVCAPVCGDALIIAPEECDGVNLGGATCVSAGFTAGLLDCSEDCTLDTSGCTLCGNGINESGEDCDGADLGGETCESLGHIGGMLACTVGCEFDETGCTDDPCLAAAVADSYLGCEFIAVDMANIDETNANEACFVVLVTNPSTTDAATITVVDAVGQTLDFPGLGSQIVLAPGDSEVLPISGSQDKCSLAPARPNTNAGTSGLQGNSAFRILSTAPIGAYQVNPYQAAPMLSADSSLLIPVHALGSQYVAVTYHGLNWSGFVSPTSISIVALQSGTAITVVPSVAMEPGGPVPAGGQFGTTLDAMQHLQILSDEYFDLTNTLILASAPVAVFAGSLCTGVPMGMGYCDHLEEQLPPVNTWGATYVAAAPPQRASEKSIWRIVAVENSTQVNIEPYSQYDSVLNRGDILEIDEAGSFLVGASWSDPNPPPDPPPVLVVNYLKGAEQTALESGVDIITLGNKRGDPAMILSVPVDQYLTSYVFSSDDSYVYNYLVVVRTDPTEAVHLDCFDPVPAARFQTVSGGYQRASVTLSSETGSDGTCASGVLHRIWSASPFGIWVYGYDQDVSYGYPGGGAYNTLNSIVVTP